MIVVGITGKKGHGKSEIAKIMKQNHAFTEKAFADPLKKCVMPLFDFKRKQVYGDMKEEIDERWGITPREALQHVGTEVVRNHMNKLLPDIGDEFWIQHMRHYFEDMQTDREKAMMNCDGADENSVVVHCRNGKCRVYKFVISDVRFKNEAEYVKNECNGVLLKVVRPDKESDDSHASETDMDNFVEGLVDYTIINDGSKDELAVKVQDFIDEKLPL